MKTYHIKDLLKKELLIIENSEQTILTTTATGYMLRDDSTNEDFFIDGYTLLGKPDEIREEDVRELVVKEDYFWNIEKCSGYVFYGNSKKCYTESALKSFFSAIESEVFWKNPLGAKPVFAYDFPEDGPSESMYDSAVDDFDMSSIKWHEAELRTFDRNRTLIFVKN